MIGAHITIKLHVKAPVKVMVKIKYIIALSCLCLAPIEASASNQHKITVRGKIYIKVNYLPEVKCSKNFLSVNLRKVVQNPNYNAEKGNEQYIYKTVANLQSENNSITGDIKQGYCQYILINIPKIKGNYDLSADIISEKQFPNDAPAYCTVSPVYSEPIGWANPIAIAELSKNKDMELTRVIAKCQP